MGRMGSRAKHAPPLAPRAEKPHPREIKNRRFVSLAKSAGNPSMNGTNNDSRGAIRLLSRDAGADLNARFTVGWRAVAVLALGLGAAFLAFAPDNAPLAQPLAGAAGPVAAPTMAQVQLRPDQVATLERALAQAETHGFEHNAFTPANLDSLLQSRDPGQRKQGQALLMQATLAYAKAVHSGRLAPGDFLHDWGLHPAAYDPTPDFLRAVTQDRLQAWLDSLPPPYTGYDSLKAGLVIYRGIAQHGGWPTLAAGPDLKQGMSDPRVAQLRARLAVEDSAVQASSSPVFDAALADAVVRAQKRYGLDPTGVVSTATLAALNVPVSQRVAQIIANMERWRWLPQQLPADRIQVNIAAAVLTVFHNDTPTLSMRVVTGRPGDETPMLSSVISTVVLNPPWNVPADIAQRELWPKERANPGYFARNEFVVIRGPDGSTRLQQKAGDMSALGRVKFEFPNIYSVYLHDTPTHSTFSRYARMVSHGCVRLEKPVVLANEVMKGDTKWTPDYINQTIAAGDTVRAPIPHPIAVFLFYWTAFATEDGVVSFRGDPYDWDRALMQRIAAAPHPVT